MLCILLKYLIAEESLLKLYLLAMFLYFHPPFFYNKLTHEITCQCQLECQSDVMLFTCATRKKCAAKVETKRIL